MMRLFKKYLAINPAVFTSAGVQNQNAQLQRSMTPTVIAPPTSRVSIPNSQLAPQAGNGGVGNMISPQASHIIMDPNLRMAANTFPLPPVIRITVTSATGAGAANTTVYLFNQNLYQNVTNNGSGAGSITYSYQDGFNGNAITELAGQTRGAIGAIIYGVYLRFIVTATRAADPTGLGNASPAWLSYNGYPNPIPNNLDVAADNTRGDFDDSIEVMPCVQNLSKWAQFAFVIPPGDTVTFVGYTTPNYKR